MWVHWEVFCAAATIMFSEDLEDYPNSLMKYKNATSIVKIMGHILKDVKLMVWTVTLQGANLLELPQDWEN